MKEYKYTINGNAYNVTIDEAGDTAAKVTVNGTQYDVQWEKPEVKKPEVKVKPAAAKPAAQPTPAPEAPKAAVSGNAIKTPLPGVILDIKVSVGDSVKKGDTVVVLEAMKMENNINADRDGKVTAIAVSKGDTVADGAPLVILE